MRKCFLFASVCVAFTLTLGVRAADSDKAGAEPNFKGFGLLTELRGLSLQFSQRVAVGAVTVPDHERAR